jgi:hypothetical protein
VNIAAADVDHEPVVLFYSQTLTDLATLPMIVEFRCGSIASVQRLARWRSVHHNAAYYGRDGELRPGLFGGLKTLIQPIFLWT